jgi:hypothetical protein
MLADAKPFVETGQRCRRHQLARPASFMNAGTRVARTRTASGVGVGRTAVTSRGVDLDGHRVRSPTVSLCHSG